MKYCLLLCIGSLLWAQDPRVIEPTTDEEGLLAIQTPSLGQLEKRVADQIEKAQQSLEATLARKDSLENSAAYALMGEIYHAYAMLDQAEACYRNALLLDNIRYSTIYMAARLFQERANLEEAEALQIKFLDRHKEIAAGWYHLGEIYLSQQKLEDASKAFSRARELRPQLAAPEAGLGRVAMAEKEYKQAVAHFDRALALLPQATRLNYFLATAWRKLGDMEKARAYMGKAGKIGPKMPDPIYARLKEHSSSERLLLSDGKAAYAAGDLQSAAKLYQQALDANPDSSSALINLGSTLGQMGKGKEAIEYFRKALALNDKNITALYNVAMLLLNEGQLEEAATHLETLLTQKSGDFQARYALAGVYQRMKRFDQALAHFERLALAQPKHEETLVSRGRLLLHLQHFDRAAEVLEQDWQRNPQMGSLVHLYARFLAVCPDRKLRNGQRALELATSVVNAQMTVQHLETLALANAEVGDCANAASIQQRVIEGATQQGFPENSLKQYQTDLARYKNGKPCAVGEP